MSEVALDRVEAELARLWEVELSRPGVANHPARVRTMTVIAICPDAAREDSVDHTLAHVAALHHVRTILLSWHAARDEAEGAGRLTAEVNLHRQEGMPVAESIHLHVRGRAQSWIPDALAQVVPFDLPVHLWWVSDLPRHDGLFDRAAALSERVILDTSELTISDIPTVSKLLEYSTKTKVPYHASSSASIVDFCWLRLRTWQELTARFFDDPLCRGDLKTLERVVVSYLPLSKETSSSTPRPSTQAVLYVSWLAARLQWQPLGWELGPTVRAIFDGPAGRVEAHFVPTPLRPVRPGAIVAIELQGASRDGQTCFRLERALHDPLVVCWSGHHPKVPIPSQCVRIRRPTDEGLLARCLELTDVDELFAASLRRCSRLVASWPTMEETRR